ncbi:MAG: MarR family winged helix-turn-helix transcriptional regulator [bacterium]
MRKKCPVIENELNIGNEKLGYLLWHVRNIWKQKMLSELKEYNLTHIQLRILYTLQELAKEKEEINQKQIAASAGLNIMMTSQLVRKLQVQKLLEIKPSGSDSRANVINLTQSGEKIISQALEKVNKVTLKFFAVSEADRKNLDRILNKLIRINS